MVIISRYGSKLALIDISIHGQRVTHIEELRKESFVVIKSYPQGKVLPCSEPRGRIFRPGSWDPSISAPICKILSYCGDFWRGKLSARKLVTRKSDIVAYFKDLIFMFQEFRSTLCNLSPQVLIYKIFYERRILS